MSFRDRFLTRQTAEAITAPSAIVLAGLGTATAILVGAPIALSAAAGAALYAGWVASHMPRQAGSVDAVVVYAHWGANYSRRVHPDQRTVARTLTEAGADVGADYGVRLRALGYGSPAPLPDGSLGYISNRGSFVAPPGSHESLHRPLPGGLGDIAPLPDGIEWNGYVGLPLAHTLHAGGLRILGFDIDPAKIEDANCPFFPDSVLQ